MKNDKLTNLKILSDCLEHYLQEEYDEKWKVFVCGNTQIIGTYCSLEKFCFEKNKDEWILSYGKNISFDILIKLQDMVLSIEKENQANLNIDNILKEGEDYEER